MEKACHKRQAVSEKLAQKMWLQKWSTKHGGKAEERGETEAGLPQTLVCVASHLRGAGGSVWRSP